ncbi:hypothetical protein [Actinomadura sp. K4S16]|uniref:hypothetical protein n=1 Tax=Actinomadura sp. K4S16 TaxID=1316147 RepID=UPI0011EDF3AC|nr:hypothetical protein [Actinomadura sp. K4S16]
MTLLYVSAVGCGGEDGHGSTSNGRGSSPATGPSRLPASSEKTVEASRLQSALIPKESDQRPLSGPSSGKYGELRQDDGSQSRGDMPGVDARCQQQGAGAPGQWPAAIDDSPSAEVIYRSGTSAVGETLVWVPEDTDMARLRLSVPAVCGRKVTSKVQGRTVIVSTKPLSKSQLPAISGAELSGNRLTMTFPDAGRSAYTTWVNVRSGQLVMAMAFIGTDGSMDAQKRIVTRAWTRAQAAVN